MTLYESSLNHLVWMAKQPGAVSHACHRALVLQADESGLWPGIAQALMERVPGLDEAMKNEAKRLKR